ncbi:hypothetical protein [Haloprofundus marisrubri]|nr:hypothetical protein [Haloprofundus marisrubri]
MKSRNTDQNYLGGKLDGWPATELIEDDLLDGERVIDGGLLNFLRP